MAIHRVEGLGTCYIICDICKMKQGGTGQSKSPEKAFQKAVLAAREMGFQLKSCERYTKGRTITKKLWLCPVCISKRKENDDFFRKEMKQEYEREDTKAMQRRLLKKSLEAKYPEVNIEVYENGKVFEYDNMGKRRQFTRPY